MGILVQPGVVDGFEVPSGPVLADGQVRYNGLLMGSRDNPFRLQSLEGWDDSPDFDLGDEPDPDGDGDIPGDMLAGPRFVTAQFALADQVIPARAQAAIAAVRRATVKRADEIPLEIQLGDEKLLSFARCIRRTIPTTLDHAVGAAVITLQWKASNPLRYDPLLQSAATSLPQPGSQTAFPWVFPATWTPGVGGELTVVNAGDRPTPLLLRLRGPAVRPVVTMAGLRLEFDLALAAAETLTVDTRTGEVHLDGTADRAHTLTGLSAPVKAFLAPPGESRLTFGAFSSTDPAAAQLAADWRPAYE